MRSLDTQYWPELRALLEPERCCALQAGHVVGTGHGRIFVDRWPAPRVALAFTGGNLGLSGEPAALDAQALAAVVHELLADWDRIFIDPGPRFGTVLRRSIGGLWRWPRVLYALRDDAVADAPPESGSDTVLRPLFSGDAGALRGLHPSIAWIGDTHDGPDGLAASGRAVGAFAGGRLVSVAAVFYRGTRYEELGVVTDPDRRSRGLSTACASVLIGQIRARGRIPCWSTTPDNRASRRVAEKLGFALEAEQTHYMVGAPVTGCLPLD